MWIEEERNEEIMDSPVLQGRIAGDRDSMRRKGKAAKRKGGERRVMDILWGSVVRNIRICMNIGKRWKHKERL